MNLIWELKELNRIVLLMLLWWLLQSKATQQGVHESLYRDLMVGFDKWGFEPMGPANPSP